MKRIRKKFVASVPMFHGQSDEFVGVLATYLRKRTFRAGEFVFYKGEIGDSMYFIKSGSADVLLELGADPVATRGKNEFVGEQALLEEAPRNAHIRASAEGKLTCYELSKAALMRVIAWFPQARSIISKPSSVRRAASLRFIWCCCRAFSCAIACSSSSSLRRPSSRISASVRRARSAVS